MATANFELYTTAGEDAGRSLILRLERLRAVLQPIFGWSGGWNGGRNGVRNGQSQSDERNAPERAACIIAFGSRAEFQPYAPIIRAVGFFLPGKQRDFMVLDSGSAQNRGAAHEFVHLVMSRNGFRLLPWIDEGLAELYSNVEERLPGGRMAIGRFIPSRVFSLRRDPWIGLAELVSANAHSPVFTAAGTVDSAYAESWLLAHMLVLDPRYAAKFPSLVTALETSETATAFRQVYDKSTDQVERDLRAYLEVGETNARILGDPPATAAPPVEVHQEADFEGRAALAEMLSNYRGRAEESQNLYRQLAADYPSRTGQR